MLRLGILISFTFVSINGFSAIYKQEITRNVEWQTAVYGKGYGASTLGARREAVSICQQQLKARENECLQQKGKFRDDPCQPGPAKLQYQVYESEALTHIMCAVGTEVIGWSGLSSVKNNSDFVAIDVCKNELKELVSSCSQEQGKVSQYRTCVIIECLSDGCVANGSIQCIH